MFLIRHNCLQLPAFDRSSAWLVFGRGLNPFQSFNPRRTLALPALLLLSTFNSQLSTAFAQGTAFTYQGRLNAGGSRATGIYDLRFTIYDAASGGNVWGVLTNAATAVTNGLFTVTLDFGSGVFDGSARWLDIGVRTNGSGAFAALTPRQPLTPTPYAIQAANATSATTAASVPASGIGPGTANINISGNAATASAVASTNFLDQLSVAPLAATNIVGILTNTTTGNADTATTAGSAIQASYVPPVFMPATIQSAITNFVPDTNTVIFSDYCTNKWGAGLTFTWLVGANCYTNTHGEAETKINSSFYVTNAAHATTSDYLLRGTGSPYGVVWKTNNVRDYNVTNNIKNNIVVTGMSNYMAFPKLAWSPDHSTIYCVFYEAHDQGWNGSRVSEMVSTNLGASWTAPWVIVPSNPAYNPQNQNFGIGRDGLQHLLFDPANGTNVWQTNALQNWVSADNGHTWTVLTPVPSTYFLNGFADGPGQILQQGNRLHTGLYSYSPNAVPWAGYDLYSDDNGTNWTVSANIGNVAEPQILPINNQLILSDARGSCSYSLDGGATFTSCGSYSFGGTGYATPAGMVVVHGLTGEPIIEEAVAWRMGSGVQLWFGTATLSDWMANPQSISNNAVMLDSWSGNDGGYCSMLTVDGNGEALVAVGKGDGTPTNSTLCFYHITPPTMYPSGDGGALTNLNAANLTGTIADARLSANVALLNANQTFTGSNTFSGVITAGNPASAFTGGFTGNGSGLTGLQATNITGTLTINTTGNAATATTAQSATLASYVPPVFMPATIQSAITNFVPDTNTVIFNDYCTNKWGAGLTFTWLVGANCYTNTHGEAETKINSSFYVTNAAHATTSDYLLRGTGSPYGVVWKTNNVRDGNVINNIKNNIVVTGMSNYMAFPQIAFSQDHLTAYMVYFNAHDQGLNGSTIAEMESHDGMKTWTNSHVIVPSVSNRDPQNFNFGVFNGIQILFYHNYNALDSFEVRPLIYGNSLDNGNTWNFYGTIPSTNFVLDNAFGPSPIRGNWPVLYTGVYSGNDTNFGWAYCLKSTDGGTNWVSHYIGYSIVEPNIYPIDTARVLCIARGVCYMSYDAGVTWAYIGRYDLNFPGGSTPDGMVIAKGLNGQPVIQLAIAVRWPYAYTNTPMYPYGGWPQLRFNQVPLSDFIANPECIGTNAVWLANIADTNYFSRDGGYVNMVNPDTLGEAGTVDIAYGYAWGVSDSQLNLIQYTPPTMYPSGDGGALTNLNAANLTGTIADARLSANVALLNANQTFTGSNTFSGVITAGNPASAFTGGFTGNGNGLTNLAANNLAAGTVPDARLSANVALLNGSPAFSTPVTMSSFLSLARTTIAPADGGTLSPAGSYVLLNPAAAIALNAVTAITSGTRTGDVLILQGNSDVNTVTIPNNANTKLTAASHVLGTNDMLVLIWTGTAWAEVSFANN